MKIPNGLALGCIIFQAHHFSQRVNPVHGLLKAEKPCLAGTQHNHGISRTGIDSDLGRCTGHIQYRHGQFSGRSFGSRA